MISFKIISQMVVSLSFVAIANAARAPKAPPFNPEVIRSSQELLLKGKRAEAIKSLVEAISGQPRDSKNYKEYRKALFKLGDIFLTIQAQKTYELGRSLMEKEPSAAIEKFNEALAIEPGQQKVKMALARTYLAKGDCRQVADLAKEALLENPYQSDFFLLRLQSKVCLSTVEDFEAELMNPYVDQEEILVYLETAQAQHLIAKEKYQSAIEILNRAKARDDQFPEIYYWLIAARKKLNQSPELELQKYVHLCKEQAVKARSRYQREPRTCRELNLLQQQLETIRTESAGT